MPNLQQQIALTGNCFRPIRPTPQSKQKGRKGAVRVRVKPVSDKRRRANREYLVRRKAFLLAHPHCQAWNCILTHLRIPLLNRKCPPSEEIHHMKKPRATYLNDESTWLAVNRKSHDWIESNKAVARELGLLCK